MENFNWKYHYDAIYIHWGIGYITRVQGIDFLRKAKSMLKKASKCCDQKGAGDSYIFLCDNLRPVVLPEQILDGQRWSTKEELEAMFDEAGLKIKHQLGPI